MINTLLKLKNAILNLLFPIFCLGCRKEGAWLCAGCRNSLKYYPPTCFFCHKLSWPMGRTCKPCRHHTKIYAFISPFSYGDTIAKELIHSLKYNLIRGLAETLADLLENYLQRYKICLPKDALLIPIPLHPNRQRERGFNQAELVAKYLSNRLGLELAENVLKKNKSTKPQIELRAGERRKNLTGVFAVTSPDLIKNKTIILLDDVKTTGTTLEETAFVLKSAGAKMVWAITVAN